MTRAFPVFRVAAIGLCAAPMCCAAPAAFAMTPQSTVTVNGTGTATAMPDELSLALSVSVQSKSVQSAMNQANQAMAAVIAKLRADGVTAGDLRTTGLSVQPQYSDKGGPAGYSVAESLTAQIRHLASAGQAIADAIKAGGNAVRVDDVTFGLDDQQAALLAKARAAAIADAHTRAAQDAAAAGRGLGEVISISETETSGPQPSGAQPKFTAGASTVPLQAGTQQVTVSVVVSYELA